MSREHGRQPIASRNLTSTFIRFRNDRRAKRSFNDVVNTGARLLDLEANDRGPGGAGVSVEMTETKLPPVWTDCAEQAREDIKNIKQKLVQLTKAQQKRLLKVFGDDDAPDKEVEAISSQISQLVRQCEQTIHQVKTRGADRDRTEKEVSCRQNVQKGLATSLQTLSQQFRQSQKDYLGKIRERQTGALWDEPLKGGDDFDLGFSDEQAQELDHMEINATQRSQEICQIATSINELHTVFKELAVLVIDQGSILDRIDYNIEQVVVQSQEANKQLQKAEESSKSNRAMKCIMILVTINMLLIVILIVKARH
jgi:syntaxin 16